MFTHTLRDGGQHTLFQWDFFSYVKAAQQNLYPLRLPARTREAEQLAGNATLLYIHHQDNTLYIR